MKKLTLILISLFTVSFLWGQVPQGINYQTVVRNASLDPIANQEVSFRIFFNDGNPTPTAFYAETHTVTTDELGMVQLSLGAGTPLFGLQFQDVDWTRVKSVQVDFDPDGGTNYTTLATLPLWSVPFSFLAQDVINKDDADADPANEIQTLVYDQMTGELSITGGNSVLVYDPDAFDRDTTNELQLLEYDSASGTLLITDGNMVRIPTVVAPDADADPMNELQDLQIDAMTGDLTISQGNTVNVYNPNDLDQDPANEIQGLQYDAMTGDLTISQGNTVTISDPGDLDKDPTNELQSLDVDMMAGTLTISGGNTVQLPSGGGGNTPWQTNANDIYYDSGNVGIGRTPVSYPLEIEGSVWNSGSDGASILNGDGLSFVNFGGISRAFIGLNSLTSTRYTGIASLGKGVVYLEDPVSDSCCIPAIMGVNAADGSGILELYSPSARKPNLLLGSALNCADCGALQMFAEDGTTSVFAGSDLGTGGYVYTFGNNGNFNTEIAFLSGQPNHGALGAINDIGLATGLLASSPNGGILQLNNKQAQPRILASSDPNDAGILYGFSPSGSFNFLLNINNSNPEWGSVGVINDALDQVGVMTCTGEGEGAIYTLGTNGNLNTILSSGAGNPNQGFIGIFDETGIPKAGFLIDGAGDGIVFGDFKNFRADHPKDENSEIWYASLEGPEVAAYIRGEAALKNGQAFIPYPEHFALMINSQTVTVILTPHEWDTYGLAVVEKRADGFVVRELKGGTGDFTFDWEVKAVRSGYENFEVVRPKLEFSDPSSSFDPEKLKQVQSNMAEIERIDQRNK